MPKLPSVAPRRRCCYNGERKLPVFPNARAINYRWFSSAMTTNYSTVHSEKVDNYSRFLMNMDVRLLYLCVAES